MKRKTQAVLSLKLLLSAGLLVLVLSRVQVTNIVDALAKADPWLVAGWYALFPFIVLLAGWRWRVLAPGLSFPTALKYTWIGIFYGHVLPGAISGDVAKGVSLALKDAEARSGLAASIIAEKAIGLGALIIFFDVTCAVVWALYGDARPELTYLAKSALLLSLAAAIATIALLRAVIRSRKDAGAMPASWSARALYSVSSAVGFYASRPQLIAKAFAISVLLHVLNIFAFYVSFKALHLEAGLAVAAVVYPVLSVMLMIPISISGVGVRDVMLAVLFALFGLSAAAGVAISWLSLLSTVPNVVIGGAVHLYEIYRKP